MNFLVSNSTIYFFPILLLNYKNSLDLLGLFLLLLELGGLFLGALLTIQACLIISKTRVFHLNMNRCLCFFLLQWFESMIGRLIILPYHKGWVVIPGNDPSKVFHEFWATSSTDMPSVRSFSDCPCLGIGLFLITHYMIVGIMSIFGMTMERSCATYLINDYECKKRPSISRTIMILLEVTSLVLASLTCTQLITIQLGLYLVIFGVLTATSGFFYIWHQNVRVHHILDTSLVIPSKYTLQARFQAKENIKSLNFTKFIVAFVTVGIIFEAIFMVFQFSELLGSYEIPILYLLELANASNPVMTVPIILMSVPCWRRRFFEQYAFVPGVRRFILKQARVATVMKVRTTSQQETEQYFNQLKKAWG